MSEMGSHDEVDAILTRALQGDGRTPAAARLKRRGFYERARRQRGRWVMSLNLTPMIDTVFNLLFFFMVVSRFGAIEGLLPARLPAGQTGAAAAAGPAVPRMPIRIRLHPDETRPGACTYRIDRLVDAPGPLNELPARLGAIRREEPGSRGQRIQRRAERRI